MRVSFLETAKALHPRVEDDIVDRCVHRSEAFLQLGDRDELINRFCRNSRSEFCHVVVHGACSCLIKSVGPDSILEPVLLL